jgi:hypothetical protein
VSRGVVGIVEGEGCAERTVRALRTAGFTKEAIFVAPDARGARAAVSEGRACASESAAAGIGTGALLGGALGWLSGVGAIAVPGLGALVAAGPILGALSGAAAGAAIGGLAGAVIGSALADREAARDARARRNGKLLLAVHTTSVAQDVHVRDVLRAHGVTDVAPLEDGGR